MTPTHKAALADHRSALVAGPIPLDQIWTLTWEQVAGLTVFPDCLFADDVWVVPTDMIGAGYAAGLRTVDFTKALPDGWSRADLRAENLIRRLKRITFLNFTQTVPGGRWKLKPLQPRMWVRVTLLLLNAARDAAAITDRWPQRESTCTDTWPIFADLTPTAFDRLRESHPTFFGTCVPRFNGLFNAGLFDDWPAGDIQATKQESKPIQPFSDPAFTEILRAAFFLAEIQSDLEACYAEISAITADAQGKRGHKSYVVPYRKERIAGWSGRILKTGFAFPYAFEVDGEKSSTHRFTAWPVHTLAGVKSMLWLCQAANAIILNTATGGRVSEMRSLSRDPLTRFAGMEGLAGLTFKESEDPRGSSRHWPLPRQAVEAVERQQSLHATLGYLEEYLWVPGHTSTTGVADLRALLPRFGKRVLSLDGRPLNDLDGAISSHRFRKTMSRLAGLCLEGASEVLYTVLGHSDIDVTLGYMLSDPDFRQDAERVRREVQDVRRKKLIAESEDCGGPAAETLRTAKAELLKKATDLGVDPDDPEIYRTIVPHLEKVREDVFCTSDSKQKGLCSKRTGKRDVGACSASCIFRLEAAAAAQLRQRTVEQAIKVLSASGTFAGARPFYQSQLLANLAPFPKTIDAFTNDSRLRSALADCDPRHFEPLPLPTRDKLIAYMGGKA